MPELPEVESVCRVLRRVLQGRKIAHAIVESDSIVLSGAPPEAIRTHLEGNLVTGVGRRGKTFWIELEDKPWLFGHLGMSGWIRELDAPSIRLHSHGEAPMEDEEGKPRFLKLLLETDEGKRIVLTDGRRLARLWLSPGPDEDPKVKKLGRDMLDAPYTGKELYEIVRKRKTAIKASLLDQALFAGVGNWVADEVLYHARLSPKRHGSSLTEKEAERLAHAIKMVLTKAVEMDADYERYPESWLFPHRWGGSRGSQSIDGHDIVREEVGGRTTAWVPDVQG